MATVERRRHRGSRLPGTRVPWLARATVAGAPATWIYLLVLLVTTWLLTTVRPRVADRLLLESSTNLHQLARDPVRVLVASAFWVGGWGALLQWVVLFALAVAPVERRLGTRRTIGIFAAGHVGATLLVAAGLWVAVRVDAVEHSVERARDVGASYGFFAVAAVAVGLLPRRPRLVLAAAVLAYLVANAAASPNFTAFGHLLAAAIGVACLRLVRSRPA